MYIPIWRGLLACSCLVGAAFEFCLFARRPFIVNTVVFLPVVLRAEDRSLSEHEGLLEESAFDG